MFLLFPFAQILREVPANEIVLTQCVMSRSGRMLFTGTNGGTLCAMKFPLTVPGEWQEHQVHSGAISKVRTGEGREILLAVPAELRRGDQGGNSRSLPGRV